MSDRLRDTVDTAVRELIRDRPTHICEHLAAGDVRRMLCVHHPASGLLCPDCAAEHARRGHVDVGTCDLCGAAGVELHHRDPLPVTIAAAAVTHPTWGDRPVTLRDAPVALWGVSACGPCAAEAADNDGPEAA